MSNEIKLGDMVRDKLTDLEGTAIAKSMYLNGCIQFQIMPRELKDSKPVEDIWIDEIQLELIEDKIIEENEDERLELDERFVSRSGGLRSHPS